MVGWIIYGFFLYYSVKNDCDKTTETAIYSSIMFVLLFLGYVAIFIYITLLCLQPCHFFFGDVRRIPQRPDQLP